MFTGGLLHCGEGRGEVGEEVVGEEVVGDCMVKGEEVGDFTVCAVSQ